MRRATITGAGGGLTSANSVPASGYIEFLTTPATIGLIRTPTTQNIIAARNAANSGDLVLAATDASNHGYFGSDASFSSQVTNVKVSCSSIGSLVIGSTASLSWLSSRIDSNIRHCFYGTTNLWDPAAAGTYLVDYGRATITTTNATPTNITTHSPSATSMTKYTATIQAYQTGGSSGTAGDGGTTVLTATYRRVGSGAPALVGSQTESDRQFTTLNPTVAFSVSSNTVQLVWTGEANKTVMVAASLVAERAGA